MPIVNYEGTNVIFTGAYKGSYNCINKGKFYEQTFLEFVRSYEISGIYLDIGTNIGNHALFFSLFCRSTRVIGFEPVPQWRKRAIDNIAANRCNVEVLPIGLLDIRQKLEFTPYETTHILNCMPLDEVLPDITKVGFVKMDIEGSEPRALLGGRAFFKRNRPVIFAECLGTTDDLFSAAALIGYQPSGLIFQDRCSPMVELVPS